jgi:hypothetical protein
MGGNADCEGMVTRCRQGNALTFIDLRSDISLSAAAELAIVQDAVKSAR